jgi:hypothetical protein
VGSRVLPDAVKGRGLDNHLVKPVDIDQLQASMAKLCHSELASDRTMQGPDWVADRAKSEQSYNQVPQAKPDDCS